MSLYVPSEVDDWLKTQTHRARSPKRKDGQSYGAAMTERKRHMIEKGIHPATGLPLRIGLADSCGTCKNCILTSNGNGQWYKCKLVPITHGSGTDIRRKWPACIKWEKGDAKEEEERAH